MRSIATEIIPGMRKYMIHCHNLVHGDHDMMARFRIGHPAEVTTRVRPTGAEHAGPDLWDRERRLTA
jgi:hypothetical protein